MGSQDGGHTIAMHVDPSRLELLRQVPGWSSDDDGEPPEPHDMAARRLDAEIEAEDRAVAKMRERYGPHWPDDPPSEPESTERRSWQQVDLTSVLDGTWQPPEPTVGERSDRRGLFYPGKSHTVVSETEGGKTWLALAAARDEMHKGNHVLYLDFEDDEGSVVSRLLALIPPGDLLAAPADLIKSHFHYLRPENPLGAGSNRDDLFDLVQTCRPTLAVIDGVTEAMVMHDLNPIDNVDAALFGRLLPRPLAAAGAAVANLDHVTKSNDNRGRYALGAVHKLNGLDGGSYLLENRQPFGIGLTGRSTIKIAKDRPGQLRAHALPSAGGLHWYGDLVLDSHGRHSATVTIEPPHEKSADFRPTRIMQRISDALETSAAPLSQRQLRDLLGGKAEVVSKALAILIQDGYVTQKTPHDLIKQYDAEDDKP